MKLRRRGFILLLASGPALLASTGSASALRGRLFKDPNGKPALKLSDGTLVDLTGDDDTVGVLSDKRLAGADFEVIGEKQRDEFRINPIHTAALYAYRDGKRLRITYWCDVCAIRTYTPGLCWCCRQETELDLRDPDQVDGK